MRNLRRIHNLYSPRIGAASKLSSLLRNEIINLLPDSLVVADRVWQRVCPRNLVGSVASGTISEQKGCIAKHVFAITDEGHAFRGLQCQVKI